MGESFTLFMLMVLVCFLFVYIYMWVVGYIMALLNFFMFGVLGLLFFYW